MVAGVLADDEAIQLVHLLGETILIMFNPQRIEQPLSQSETQG